MIVYTGIDKQYINTTQIINLYMAPNETYWCWLVNDLKLQLSKNCFNLLTHGFKENV